MNRPYRSSMGRFVLCPCSPALEDHYYIYCPRNPWSQSGRRKGGLRWEGYAENDTLPPNFPGASLHQVLGFYRAMLCIRGTSHEPVSVCVCVCISVCPPQVGVLLNRLNVRSHKKPHDNPGSLFFWCQRSPRNSTGVTSYEGTKCRWGGSKSATFDK